MAAVLKVNIWTDLRFKRTYHDLWMRVLVSKETVIRCRGRVERDREKG